MKPTQNFQLGLSNQPAIKTVWTLHFKPLGDTATSAKESNSLSAIGSEPPAKERHASSAAPSSHFLETSLAVFAASILALLWLTQLAIVPPLPSDFDPHDRFYHLTVSDRLVQHTDHYETRHY